MRVRNSFIHNIYLFTHGEMRIIQVKKGADKSLWEFTQSLLMNSFRYVSLLLADDFAIANFHIFHSCLFGMEQSPEILDKYKVFVNTLLQDPALRRFSA